VGSPCYRFGVTARSPAETPLMRQYLDIKDQHPDAIVLFRLGDFYEMFFEDAVIGARLLDLALTTRDKGRDDAVPMCGVPHHAARVYIAKLTDLGHKVVLAEQTEDPRLAKGLVKREVVRIVTPGVVLDDDVLEPKLPRYLAALVPAPRPAAAQPAAAVVLDEAAIANLELTETLIGKRKQGSLLDVIDDTATAPGGRLLRRWLLYPLVDVAQIRRRQDAVAWLVERPALCEAIRR